MTLPARTIPSSRAVTMLIVCLGLLLGTQGVHGTPASAHSYLVASVPTDRSELQAAPTENAFSSNLSPGFRDVLVVR